MDRVGRRKLVLTGIIGCLISLSVYTAMVALFADAGTNKAGLGVGVCALYVFLAFFAIGLDAAGWVLISEIFPTFIRAKGFALSVASQSVADIIYLQVTPQGFANLGWKYLMVCLLRPLL
jgi:MFS family permease